MLLIDILNGLHFAGADFVPSLAAAQQRRRFLNPILRRVLEYAATEPGAYEWRFSQSLLDSAAYLLAEAKVPDFLRLATPMMKGGDRPSLLGFHPEDSSRLLAAAIGPQFPELVTLLQNEQDSEEFCSTAVGALVALAHWHPELRDQIVSNLRGLLRSDCLRNYEPVMKQILVDGCCRLGAVDFLLDLQLAVDRGVLDAELTSEAVLEADRRGNDRVWVGDWREPEPINFSSSFIKQHQKAFRANELYALGDLSEPDVDALERFNTIATPARDFVWRFTAIHQSPELLDVVRRVIRRAATCPDYLWDHHPIGVSAAICLGAPVGDEAFTRCFVALLGLPDETLERLLGDDLTEMCMYALAESARTNSALIKQVVEDPDTSPAARSVALGALMHQVRVGQTAGTYILDYCRELISRRREFQPNTWLWSDVARIAAELQGTDLLPHLKTMVDEGFFTEEVGCLWYSAEDLDELFATPAVETDVPLHIDAAYLLTRCDGFQGMSVKTFWSDLEPPHEVSDEPPNYDF